MWTRKELKTRGKAAFKNNYWKTVLVSFMMMVLIGGAAGGSGGSGGRAGTNHSQPQNETQITQMTQESSDSGINVQFQAGPVQIGPDSGFPAFLNNFANNTSTAGKIAIAAAFIIIFLVLAVIAIAVDAFVLNPLSGGFRRFFIKNLNDRAELKELAYCYDHGYMQVVKTLFLRDVYLILWTLLLVIPGIIKAYEYRMIPYIVAEHPEMPAKEVFAQSREMMRGQKWNAFVLDLSFIGWDILAAFTAGLLYVFYVRPYKDMTDAALYEQLAYVEKK